MTPEQLYKDAVDAKRDNARMSVVFSKAFKKPTGFPRGKFLCETDRGIVYSFDPERVIKWVIKNNLID